MAPNSNSIIGSIGVEEGLHADFGSGLWEGRPIGIPITIAAKGQSKTRVSFDYAEESDKGPYPLPNSVKIEGGRSADGDRHAIVVDKATCRLYELFALYPSPWRAGSGAICTRSDA